MITDLDTTVTIKNKNYFLIIDFVRRNEYFSFKKYNSDIFRSRRNIILIFFMSQYYVRLMVVYVITVKR